LPISNQQVKISVTKPCPAGSGREGLIGSKLAGFTSRLDPW
jgi:hypothetical protein